MKPFHQAARYETVRRAVEAMRSKQQHTILEVGSGSHGNLAEYLPKDQITFLDKSLTNEAQKDPRFVIGDATSLQYPDSSFDFVIGLDVLEHIPSIDRNDFLREVCRVARKGVFLSFPQHESGYTATDETLRAVYLASKTIPPDWIDEHIDCTLPNADEIEQALFELVGNEHTCRLYSIRRSLMQKMLYLEAISSRYPNIAKYYQVINDQYITDILPYDMVCEEQQAIKCIFLISLDRPASEIQNKFLAHLHSDTTVLNLFEASLRDQINLFMQLEILSKEALLEEVAIQNQKQLLQNFEVLNGRTQAALGSMGDEMTARCQQLLQNFEVLNGRTQRAFGVIGERLDATQKILSRIADDRVVLDVILITYNQSKYIEESVRSIISQRTKFRFRVLVADDCSKDDTVEKIRRLSDETDIPFIFLKSDHNLGIMKNYQRAFAACTAEFTAILEGDDIWTDPLRLQKHVEFLQQHSECSMSFNRYIVKNFKDGTFYMQPRFSSEDEQKAFRYVSGHDLAYDNLIGNFSTSVYRTACLHALPEQLFDMKAYDWLTNILISKMGLIGCLMGASSIYRIHTNGVWSGQNRKDQLESLANTIDEYNQYTNFEFNAGFTAHKERVLADLKAFEIQNQVEKIVPEQAVISGKRRVKKIFYRIICSKRYLPPIVTAVVRLLVPSALQDVIRKKCNLE